MDRSNISKLDEFRRKETCSGFTGECKVIDIFSRVDRNRQEQKAQIHDFFHKALSGDLTLEEESGRLGNIRRLLMSATPL